MTALSTAGVLGQDLSGSLPGTVTVTGGTLAITRTGSDAPTTTSLFSWLGIEATYDSSAYYVSPDIRVTDFDEVNFAGRPFLLFRLPAVSGYTWNAAFQHVGYSRQRLVQPLVRTGAVILGWSALGTRRNASGETYSPVRAVEN